MEIHTKHDNGITFVSVEGKLDGITSPEYERALMELLDSGRIRVVVDFDALKYISSAGLRVVLSTAKHANSLHGRLVLANLQGNVKEVFAISGFTKLFPLHESVEAAAAAFAAPAGA